MKREDLITPADLQAMLAGSGGDVQVFAPNEPISAQQLHALQQAVVLLSRQVAELQAQLREHSQEQERRQEQLLRQFQHHLEYKLYEQMMSGGIVQRTPVTQQQEALPSEAGGAPDAAPEAEADQHPLVLPPSDRANAEEPEGAPPTFSRVNSYRKIRKRKKTFIERLFD